jgi:hypothetical protein
MLFTSSKSRIALISRGCGGVFSKRCHASTSTGTS